MIELLLKVTILLALALTAARAAARARAATRHALLASALVAALALPALSLVPLPLQLAVPIPSAVAGVIDSTPDGPSPGGNELARDAQAASAFDDGPPGGGSRLTVRVFLFAAWMVTAAVILLVTVVDLWKLGRLARTGFPWPEGERAVAAAARDAGLRRQLRVLLHDEMRRP